MRILIAAGGTRGDVQPMLALALELRERGHQIRFCGPPNFQPWLEGHGLSFRALGADIQAFLAKVGTNMHRALVSLREDVRREFAVFAEEAQGVDLILGASVTCAGVSYGEKLGVPYAYVMFSPSLIPSAHHPSPTCPLLRLPQWMNRLSWWATRKVWNLMFRRILNEERARLGLGPIRDTWQHIQNAPLVLASDPALSGPPSDAPKRLWQTGPVFLPETEALPAEVERFLAAGPPPVYLGFGSMPDRKPGRSTALVRQAIAKAGVRAIIARGWAGLDAVGTDAHVCVVDAVPHDRLFPRVAAVVHHGGAGTTASAARAGVPQLIVPHLLDQFFWADQVAQLGLGPKPISRHRLSADRLAAGLRACATDARYREAARALAARVRQDGLTRAATVIEALAGPDRVPTPLATEAQLFASAG